MAWTADGSWWLAYFTGANCASNSSIGLGRPAVQPPIPPDRLTGCRGSSKVPAARLQPFIEGQGIMAEFTVNPTRFDPYKNFKFPVKWDGHYVAGLSQ